VDITFLPVADAQRLYKQWQDGQLLDNEERKALKPADSASETQATTFADVLKSTTELDS
jgi:hypothetical protein